MENRAFQIKLIFVMQFPVLVTGTSAVITHIRHQSDTTKIFNEKNKTTQNNMAYFKCI